MFLYENYLLKRYKCALALVYVFGPIILVVKIYLFKHIVYHSKPQTFRDIDYQSKVYSNKVGQSNPEVMQ